jgi:hypothetical protein
MIFCIVVARYNENVKWTKKFPNVTIYNKGAKLHSGFNEVFLNNVGREGHTYFKHICDHYENLADYTVFLQGRPFDHSPNIVSNLTKFLNSEDLKIDFEFLSESIHVSSLDVESSKYWQCKNIKKTWERVFGENIGNRDCIFGAGAQFIVSKERILRNKKDFYQNIVDILGYTVDPLEGYDVERFYKYIFDEQRNSLNTEVCLLRHSAQEVGGVQGSLALTSSEASATDTAFE